MSALGIYTGRIGSINHEIINTRKGPVPKMTLQIITDDGYTDSAGNWVNKSSSFLLTEWGQRAGKIRDNRTLQVGFTIYATAKMTVNAVNSGNDVAYYTDNKLEDFKILARPKAWHDNRNNGVQNQQQELPLESTDFNSQQRQKPNEKDVAIPDHPVEDDIPF